MKNANDSPKANQYSNTKSLKGTFSVEKFVLAVCEPTRIYNIAFKL